MVEYWHINIPKHAVYGIFTYIWLICIWNIGKSNIPYMDKSKYFTNRCFPEIKGPISLPICYLSGWGRMRSRANLTRYMQPITRITEITTVKGLPASFEASACGHAIRCGDAPVQRSASSAWCNCRKCSAWSNTSGYCAGGSLGALRNPGLSFHGSLQVYHFEVRLVVASFTMFYSKGLSWSKRNHHFYMVVDSQGLPVE